MATKKRAWVYCEDITDRRAGVIESALKSWDIDIHIISSTKGVDGLPVPDFIVISFPRLPPSYIKRLIQSLPRGDGTRVIVVSENTALSAQSVGNSFEVIRSPNDSRWFEELRDMLGV